MKSKIKLQFLTPLVLILLLVFQISSATINSNQALRAESTSDSDSVAQGEQNDSKAVNGLKFTIHEDSPTAQAVHPVPQAQAQRLPDSETTNLLKLLPPLPESTTLVHFSLPVQSLPPPSSMRAVAVPFPPKEQKPPTVEVAVPTLRITNKRPEGLLKKASNLTVTFSQPMVAVSTQAQLSAKTVPVKLTPPVKGEWKWFGTQTLTFEPENKHFPMSTHYSVEIPASTKSVNGGKLESAESWSFTTDTLRIISHYPESNQSIRPSNTLFLVQFNQRIQQHDILGLTTVKVGGKAIQLTTPTEAEIHNDKVVSERLKKAPAGTTLVFKAAETLPLASQVSVQIASHAPSAEGPLKSEGPAQFIVRTYSPLTLLPPEQYEKTVYPGNPVMLRFSNQIDAKLFKPSYITMTPSAEDIETQLYGQTIYVYLPVKGRGTHQLHVSDALVDEFGQSLTGNRTREFEISPTNSSVSIGEQLVVMPSKFPSSRQIISTNVPRMRVRIYAVKPNQYSQFITDPDRFKSTVTPLSSTTIQPKQKLDEPTYTTIDLAPYLKSGVGQLLIEVNDTRNTAKNVFAEARGWVQATNLGLDVYEHEHSLTAWVSDINTGAPVTNATVTVLPLNITGKTDDSGLVQLQMPTSPYNTDRRPIIVAEKNGDSAFIEHWSQWYQQATTGLLRWYVINDRSPYRPGETAHIKGILRYAVNDTRLRLEDPAAMVNGVSYELFDPSRNSVVKGTTKLNQFGGFDLEISLPKNMNLGEANLHLTAQCKSSSMPGITNTEEDHQITVSEFRRPEFEMNITQSTEDVQVVGGAAVLSANAHYFAGGVLSNAEIDWTANAQPSTYHPPGFPEFTFGPTVSTYRDHAPENTTTTTQKLSGKTDSSGKHTVRLDFLSVNPPRPTSVKVDATVHDVNRQAWSDSTTVLVLPSSLCVGLKSDNRFIKKGESIPLSVVVTDVKGTAKSKVAVHITCKRITAYQRYLPETSQTVAENLDVQELTTTSSDSPVSATLHPNKGGWYEVLADVADAAGHKNQASFEIWVEGGDVVQQEGVKTDKLLLIDRKTSYNPGDTASILVQSPFAPAEGMATVWHNGLSRKIPLHTETKSFTLELPISDDDLPSVSVQIDLAGSNKKPNISRVVPSEASGTILLPVSTNGRTLKLTVKPESQNKEPGENMTVAIDVADASGEPRRNAQVTVAVVDEALLSLSGYRFSDPINSFYPALSDSHLTYRDRELIDLTQLLEQPEQAQLLHAKKKAPVRPRSQRKSVGYYDGESRGFGGGFGGGYAQMGAPGAFNDEGASDKMFSAGKQMEMAKQSIAHDFRAVPSPASIPKPEMEQQEAAKPVRVRSNFDALAHWSPTVVTDNHGHAVVSFKLPDNLTAYRVMAVASCNSNLFGEGESTFNVRVPLMVKPSAPRFLNFGDKCELPIVIHNQSDSLVEVKLAARASNAAFTEGQGRRFTVPANDRVEVRLPCATEQSGEAKFQVIAVAGAKQDAAEFSLPVYTPATTEAFATYGEIDNGAIMQKIESPEDVVPDFGDLQLTTSSTVLQTLTDAFLYLHRYPFECSEQISSRVLSVSVSKDVLNAFNAKGMPSESSIEATLSADIHTLQTRQRSDGGFALWTPQDKEIYPYVTLHVTHALLRAKEAGFKVPQDMLDKALAYAKSIDHHIDQQYRNRHLTAARDALSRLELQSFALYVRNLAGDTDVYTAKKLLNGRQLDAVPVESLALLYNVLTSDPSQGKALSEQLHKYVNNHVVENAGTAQFVSQEDRAGDCWFDYELFDSPHRSEAIILDALIAEGKDPSLVTKLMRSLFGQRTRGRWDNTQENAYVMIAVKHYFDKYEAQTPDFQASSWLGKDYLGSTTFKGRSNEYKSITVPMSFLVKEQHSGTRDLIINKEGAGRLYYRLALNYAPRSLKLDAMDRGFAVQRTYEGIEKPSDVIHSADGSWHFKSGSLVKVKLKIALPAVRHFVAVVDPLPAGAEALDENLKGTQKTAAETDGNSRARFQDWWWHWDWWTHANKRDNQVEVFADNIESGSYDYSYTMRATTPGAFVVPPAKAEEMYAPETFGRTKSEKVVIE